MTFGTSKNDPSQFQFSYKGKPLEITAFLQIPGNSVQESNLMPISQSWFARDLLPSLFWEINISKHISSTCIQKQVSLIASSNPFAARQVSFPQSICLKSFYKMISIAFSQWVIAQGKKEITLLTSLLIRVGCFQTSMWMATRLVLKRLEFFFNPLTLL